MTTHTLAIAAAAVLIAAPVRAQEPGLPRVEVGVIGSGLLIAPTEDGVTALVGGGPSITLGVTQRIRVDVRAQVLGPNQGTDVYGLYETVIRFPVTRSSAAAPALSMTAGVSGFFSFYRFREHRTPRRDGSVIVYPGQRGVRATAPRLGSVGLAHQRIVSNRVSVLLGADAVVGRGAIVARGTVGLSFGVRRYR